MFAEFYSNVSRLTVLFRVLTAYTWYILNLKTHKKRAGECNAMIKWSISYLKFFFLTAQAWQEGLLETIKMTESKTKMQVYNLVVIHVLHVLEVRYFQTTADQEEGRLWLRDCVWAVQNISTFGNVLIHRPKQTIIQSQCGPSCSLNIFRVSCLL